MDLDALENFANANEFGVTRPLRNEQVVQLAEHWLPQLHFHEKERYHPIGLDEAIGMVESQFAAMSPQTQQSFLVTQLVKERAFAIAQEFVPPVLTVPDDPAPTESSSSVPVSTVRVLTESLSIAEALGHPDVGASARISYGASDERARRFFSGVETVLHSDIPAPGDPLVPRARTEDGPRITVMAAYKNLLETLEYNLLTERADGYPADALRTGFDILSEVLRPAQGNVQPSRAELRTLLLAMIEAHRNNEPLPSLPSGVMLDRRAWDAVTRYALLEYSFYYAYNDFERYQTAIFENEHEGDDEGCCLVFDRNAINLAANASDPAALLMVRPHSIITSVHEEYQGADLGKVFATPVQPPADPVQLRDSLGLNVWIAGGSHATYLTSGTHDLVDFGDYLGWIDENAPWLWLASPLVLVGAIVLSALEHFIDTEDFTSDAGFRAGPGTDPTNDALSAQHRVVTLPMSSDVNVYGNRELLGLVAYPGFWGGHDGLIDKSPPFRPKTGRFFRKLLSLVG